ncbi:MAG: hypothetical protein INH37_14800 [Myxococcaceae bacterium]|nr:hypothetical protein [Myxococcaceae bacterium]
MSEQVVVTPGSAPTSPDSDPAYVERMVAKAEGREPNAPANQDAGNADQGNLILGKFKSQDDLVKAYTELEKKLGAPKNEQKPDAPAPKVEAEGDAQKDEQPAQGEAEKALDAKGLDYASFSSEYAEKGELSADSYAKLEKAGIPRSMVDAYIAGQQALVQNQRSEVFKVAGGEEAYAEAVNWAKTNMTQAEKDAFNAVVNGGDLNATKLAVQGLMARYRAAEGNEPNLMGGDTSTVGSEGYSSWAEVKADMAKPEYSNDPAFRSRVEQKLMRSAI